MIRAFGGEVSWDAIVGTGASFDVDDPTITHQISDRPRESVDMKHLARFYIQPQWVFDSINRRVLLPAHKYFLGEPLPPHLSPFMEETRRIGDYVPPEEQKLADGEEEEEEKVEDNEGEEDESSDGEEEEDSEEESEAEAEEDSEEEEETEEDKMKVLLGKPEIINKDLVAKKMEEEEYRLRVMMIKKKHKGLYKSMIKSRKKRTTEAKSLEKKRKVHDEQAAEVAPIKKKKKQALV